MGHTEGISSREITEWMAYERATGTLGQERDDVLAALVAQTVANVMRGKKQRAYKLDDFLIRWGTKAKQTPQQMLTLAKALYGGGRKED